MVKVQIITFSEAERKDPYLKRLDEGEAVPGFPAVFSFILNLYDCIWKILCPGPSDFLPHMLLIFMLHELVYYGFWATPVCLCIGNIVLYFIICYLRGFVARRITCDYLKVLYLTGQVRVYHPVSITKQGSHFASTYRGIDGFYRVDKTEGYKTFFTPALNVFSPRLTVSSWLGLHVSCEFRSKRVDSDYILVEAFKWHQDVGYFDPYMHFVSGDMAVLGFIKDGVNIVKLQASRYVGCELKLDEFDALRFRTGAKPNMGYMEVVSKDMEFDSDSIPKIAMVLKEELRALDFQPWVEPKALGGDGDVEGEILADDGREPELDRARPLGKLLPQPYDQESVVYAFNYASEEVTLKERVTKYLDNGAHKVPAKYLAYRNEFVQLLVPDEVCHSLAPDDLEVVLERQKRASQVLGYEDTKHLPDPNFSLLDTTFQKGEVYSLGKAPRLIVNPPAPKRVETNGIITPLTALLKNGALKGIYGFGTANYIQENFERFEACEPTMDAFETDVSGMDANTIKFFREMDEMILKRAFQVRHHDRVLTNHRAQYEPGKLRFRKGHIVNLGHSIRSGEGGTSCWNTNHGTFVEYSWLRELGFSPKEAKKMLGLHGGDDGLSKAWGTEESLKQVGSDLHLPLKVRRVAVGKPISFLGLTKMPGIPLFSPDVVRFCSKIAYTHVKGVPLNQVLLRKCEPYVRMYPNVPLVGNLCRAVVRILKKQGVKIDSRYDELCRSGSGYMMTMLDGAQFPGPETADEYYILEAYVAETLELPLSVLREVCDRYDDADEFSKFPSGYIKKVNGLLDSGFSFLLRDLYIRGPSVKNFDSNVHTEVTPAVQKIPVKDNDKAQSNNQQKGGDTTSSCSSSTIETDSSTSSGKKAKITQTKNRGSKAHEVRDGLPESRPRSS